MWLLADILQFARKLRFQVGLLDLDDLDGKGRTYIARHKYRSNQGSISLLNAGLFFFPLLLDNWGASHTLHVPACSHPSHDK